MREIILNMKNSGMPIDNISCFTKLSVKEIEQLIADNLDSDH